MYILFGQVIYYRRDVVKISSNRVKGNDDYSLDLRISGGLL